MSARLVVRAARGLAAAIVVLTLAAWWLRPLAPPGWLGVAVDDAPGASPAAALTSVLADGPAARAGLEVGDRVRAAAGRRIRSALDLVHAVKARGAGAVLPLTIRRGERELELTATLAARPADVYPLFEHERDAWQEPERVLDLLDLAPASAVADLGAGAGYFTERLAARVGPEGRVVAIEIDRAALADLARRFPATTHPQVEVRRGTVRDPRLEPAAFDLVLLVDTYHELADAPAILAAVARALRPDGRLAVVDRPARGKTAAAHTIAEARVVAEADAAGFVLRSRHDLPLQFLLLFGKQAGNSP